MVDYQRILVFMKVRSLINRPGHHIQYQTCLDDLGIRNRRIMFKLILQAEFKIDMLPGIEFSWQNISDVVESVIRNLPGHPPMQIETPF